MKNYRPVSNLTFISKVIEKVVSGRLNEHLIQNRVGLTRCSQHTEMNILSTETALIKVQNDILSALDAGSSAILLDISASFDTIYHNILLSQLCNIYGITGNALDWFRAYLNSRIQRVVIEDYVSVDQELGFGVPQDSVLGQKIYCMYTKHVTDIIQRQVYIEIKEWMNQNMLNHNKTELIVFTSKYRQDLYNDLSITISDTVMDCSSQVKDLRVIFD